jgi:hypothetical protein
LNDTDSVVISRPDPARLRHLPRVDGGEDHGLDLPGRRDITADTPPPCYLPSRYGDARPFEYRSIRIGRSNAEKPSARQRLLEAPG